MEVTVDKGGEITRRQYDSTSEALRDYRRQGDDTAVRACARCTL